MKRVLCLAIGHDRQPVPFSSIRFACRRCGLDLGPVAPAWPLVAQARAHRDVLRGEAGGAAPHPVPRGSRRTRLVGGPWVAAAAGGPAAAPFRGADEARDLRSRSRLTVNALV